jgi:hypothetical protein
MPSDSTEKWPELLLGKRGMVTGAAYDEPFVVQPEERSEYEPHVERYVSISSIREKLTSDEAVRALARERFDYLSGYGGVRWEEAHESIRRQEEDKARLFFEAAFKAATFPEEAPQTPAAEEKA